MVRLVDRVALVTGSSRGIGRDIAVKLAEIGYSVAVNYRKRDEEAARTVVLIRERGGEARYYKADVSDPEQVDILFDRIEEEMGKVLVLVNNAGWGVITPATQTPYETWRRHIAVNLDSVFLCSSRALPGMIEEGWGRIVNITSVAGITGLAWLSAYSAAKAGVIGLTKALAQELAGTGVTVNAVAAGFVRTRMGESYFQAQGIDMDEWASKATITGRVIEPEEIAELVAYLVSEAASNITGQVITIDSGLSIAGGYLLTKI